MGPFISRDGAYGETAFFHKATKSLFVTDAVQQVSPEIPKIFLLDEAAKKPLLYHARDGILDRIDASDMRQLEKGWRRVQLFGLYFMPAAIDIHSVPQSWKERRPDVNQDFAGIYPWDWVRDDKAAFKALSGDSKDALLVAPIIQTLILNRNPVETLDWVDEVCRWDFKRIVPAHLKNNIAAGPSSFRRAFSFLTVEGEPAGQPKPRKDDLQTLLDAGHLQVLKYEIGQFYKTHHDQNSPTTSAWGPRMYTFFMYLNDGEGGGETHFPRLNITISPKRGRALLWPSVLDDDPKERDFRTEHEAVVVTAGKKYAANYWLHMYDFQLANDRGCGNSEVFG